MSRGLTLLLLTAAPGEADPTAVEEFLRVAVGLAAGGHSLEALTLHEFGPLTAVAETYVQALAEERVIFSPLPAAQRELRAALLRSDSLLRLAAVDRTAEPDLLLVDDEYVRATASEQLRMDLRSAGQAIRVR